MSKLAKEFYQGPDVVGIARDLLGKRLFTRIGGQVTGGLIVETEAYRGYDDLACHARGGRRTNRNRIMYEAGGLAYVYLCYGIHHLFNVVTNIENRADAILVRAVQPVSGKKTMLARRGLDRYSYRVASGPGLVSQALGIELAHYGMDLTGDTIWIEDGGLELTTTDWEAGPRINVAYAKEHALYPWRFFLSKNGWVSGSSRNLTRMH